MPNYIKKIISENSISIVVCFYIEQNNVVEMGKKIKKTVSNPFGKFIIRFFPKIGLMNGYDWESFLNYYLKKNYPDVLMNMNTDPEAGMYVAFYDFGIDNEKKADKLVDIIIDFIENERDSLQKIKEDGKLIQWNHN
ncbi:hypothetical protein DBB36_14430 [Flavobacterium sp. WLB]|uniref:Imm51 family immunity protein n=1 Tax=unclassified Flavobacterium TaxID=196869 RepID=UPI0006BED999|nr:MULTISPECIES: Imm51 family immunity protein [unclassified Flavobacterium]KOP39607.1 hypothetical protein AKO67_03370 [Flavobacterium sp. VMW]PUU69309.1 hypothetical protein DBB36_14430 [Flavobacterium sp. WLB]